MKLAIIIASMFAAASLHAGEQSNGQLQAEIVQLQQQLAALRPLVALAPLLSVQPTAITGVGTTIVF